MAVDTFEAPALVVRFDVYARSWWIMVLKAGFFLLTTFLIVLESSAMTLSKFPSMRIKVGNFVLFFALLALWHVISYAFALYNSRYLSGPRYWKQRGASPR
jgi:hypothetical protein